MVYCVEIFCVSLVKLNISIHSDYNIDVMLWIGLSVFCFWVFGGYCDNGDRSCRMYKAREETFNHSHVHTHTNTHKKFGQTTDVDVA